MTISVQQSVVQCNTVDTTDSLVQLFRRHIGAHVVSVRRLVTYQEACRQVLEARITRKKRRAVATALGFKSLQALDYLVAGFAKDKKSGKITPRYITFEHLAALAESDGISYAQMLEEVLFALQLLQGERESHPEPTSPRPAAAPAPRARSRVPTP